MSATGKIKNIHGLESVAEDTCKIVVFYEDSWARARAMSVCERLVEQFAEDLDFEFRWWMFKRLADPLLARHAMEAAASGDIVLFCAHSSELPPEAGDWLESWAESGEQSDGALALVLAERAGAPETGEKMISRFKWAAQRLGMDFLHLPVPLFEQTPIMPDAPVHLSSSTQQRTLHHWGLNE